MPGRSETDTSGVESYHQKPSGLISIRKTWQESGSALTSQYQTLLLVSGPSPSRLLGFEIFRSFVFQSFYLSGCLPLFSYCLLSPPSFGLIVFLSFCLSVLQSFVLFVSLTFDMIECFVIFWWT